MGFLEKGRMFRTALALGAIAFSIMVRGEELLQSPPVVSTDSSVINSTPPVVPGYVYKGDRFRDPFIPLIGAPTAGYEIARPVSEPLSPFNPVGAELKGILKTTTGRWAVIRTSEGGTYLVQNGKIFDPKRKAVEGFQGIVKEKTVVILGPKNQEVEVRLKKDAEALKAPH